MTDPRAALQQSLGGAFTIERELGGGGMSRTYLALDTALNRRVVVKLLSPDLAQGVSVDRFKREIQLAAALQHPHIVPVLAAGESDGLPYYTMPYVSGESLRERIARGPLAVGETVSMLRDVAKALAFAHGQGVVHRDIKPDNVLLAGGSATVADFGIAKAITAARTQAPGATLTQLGTSLGTPAYMAPEQAAGDPGTDGRADLYAFGVMAYEMLVGQVPFHGLTPQRMLAAQMSERPRPIAELRADLPQALVELVMRCLEKEPDRRPQSAADVVRYLETVTSGSGQTAAPAVLIGTGVSLGRAIGVWALAFVMVAVLAKAAIVGIGLPDWVFPGAVVVMLLGLPAILVTAYVHRSARRALTATPTLTPGGSPVAHGTMMTMALKASPHVTWRRTTIGGAVAVGSLVVLTGAWMVMRAFGIGPAASLISSGKFAERERVILAEFNSPANDSLLGPTVTDAFRTDLAQSTSLSVMSASNVRTALQLMQRPTNVRVDFAVAREIATREGIKAVIDGQIVELGGSYVLSARLVSAQDGEELATFRETAADDKEIIPAIGRLSKAVRSRVGESLRTVQGARTLDRVTTPSLDAFKKYSAATRTIEVDGDFARFEELMTQAIALDTGFAMAYRKLAIELGNRGIQRPRQEALLQKAYDNRDRLSEQERYIMLGSYWNQGPTPDPDKAIDALESLLEIDSVNVTALNNLASAYHDRGDYAEAAALAERAIRVQPTASVFFTNAIHNQLHLGRIDDARATLATARRNIPRNPNTVGMAAGIALELGHTDSAAALYDSLIKARPTDLPTRGGALFQLANIHELDGRIAQARRELTDARRTALQLGNPQAEVNVILDSAYYAGWYEGDTARALRYVDRAVAHRVWDSLPAERRNYPAVAETYAVSGRPEQARAALRQAEAQPGSEEPDGERVLHRVRGLIAQAEGKHEEAVRELKEALGGGCTECGYPEIAIAYDRAGNVDSTIAYFTRFVEARAIPIGPKSQFQALALKRLAELHDAKGNAAEAIKFYERFIALWKNADASLQPQVRRARERMQELQRNRG